MVKQIRWTLEFTVEMAFSAENKVKKQAEIQKMSDVPLFT